MTTQCTARYAQSQYKKRAEKNLAKAKEMEKLKNEKKLNQKKDVQL